MTNTHKVQGIIQDDRREEQVEEIGYLPTVRNGEKIFNGSRDCKHNYFVGERERRKNKTLAENMDKHFSARRTKHNYDSPPKPKLLVYVKVEPDPTCKMGERECQSLLRHGCPYQKDDILELGDMTIKVDKVIGVEEVVTPVFKEKVYPACGIACDRKWHWAILGEEV